MSKRSFWEDNPRLNPGRMWSGHPVLTREIYRRLSGGASDEHWLIW